MNHYCPHCEGELLRHGVARKPTGETYGIRYRCRECNRTFTQRTDEETYSGVRQYNATGRPMRKDWRMAA